MGNVSIYRPEGCSDYSHKQFEEYLDALVVNRDFSYSEARREVISDLSSRLLASPMGRAAPQIISLGFWLRPAAIESLLAPRQRENEIRVPRGLAYQIPPSNVDTLFVYSWVISFLVGNANVVRLPSELSEVTTWLLKQLLECVDRHGYSNQQVFCQFDKNSTISELISSKSDLRVIWGGDEKIKALSGADLKPDGLSVGFSDRKSMSVINITEYQSLDEAGKIKLAENLYNDTYWFDQMGCGSPRLIVFVGKKTFDSSEFFDHLVNVASRKNYGAETGVDIAKLVFANEMLGTGVADQASRLSPDLYTLDVKCPERVFDSVQGGGALFQMQISVLEELSILVRNEIQTISVFGLEREEKEKIASLFNGKGGYRIVPLGEALLFDVVWDGIDLFEYFGRLVAIR